MNTIKKLIIENSYNEENLDIIIDALKYRATEAGCTVDVQGNDIQFYWDQDIIDMSNGAHDLDVYQNAIIENTIEDLRLEHSELF